MLKIEKATPEQMREAAARTGKRFYPFDKMEIGDKFHASIHRYRDRNGADKSIDDMRKSIFAASQRVKPMKFRMLTAYHEGNKNAPLGLDVVRVA